jgi:hypothetical protein
MNAEKCKRPERVRRSTGRFHRGVRKRGLLDVLQLFPLQRR